MIEPVRLEDAGLVLLDQRLLPREEISLTLTSAPDVVEAIRTMVVRGAPAIGLTAAYGLVLEARSRREQTPSAFMERVREAATALEAARPTAVNLSWAVRRVMRRAEGEFEAGATTGELIEHIESEARAIHEEDVAANRAMGRLGAAFVPDGACVLTHCNAGALATAGYGTALGVVRAAVEEGKSITVLADETRPFLQGARLTAWELHRDGIPVTVITDGMAGALMAKGEVDLVVVGADRIAVSGDVANKIGTYTVAVLARRHGIPFYVAAPTSTIDPECPSGDRIPIEDRDPSEVTHFQGSAVTPEGVTVRNPAFDVTPAELVTAIITEKAVLRAPYERAIRSLLGLTVLSESADAPAEEAAEMDSPIENGLEEETHGDAAIDDDGDGPNP